MTQNWDPAAKLDGLHTWAWQPGYPRPTGEPRVDIGVLNERICWALEAGLAAKDDAYHVVIDERFECAPCRPATVRTVARRTAPAWATWR